MTKFEEELFNKVPCKFELTTEAEYKKSTLINHFKNWHSDEEFQELLDKYSNLNDHYEKEVIKSSKLETSNLKLISEGDGLLSDNATLTKEIADLKSQLQQQALPVVPECVAEWYEENKKDLEFAIYNFCVELDERDEISTEFESWFDESYKNHPIATLIRMKDGYTVEKPQLFYLKHIDMSKSDAHLNWYLAKGPDNVLRHQGIKEGKLPKLKCILKLTQQEIDSMETGSYEQIEVTE